MIMTNKAIYQNNQPWFHMKSWSNKNLCNPCYTDTRWVQCIHRFHCSHCHIRHQCSFRHCSRSHIYNRIVTTLNWLSIHNKLWKSVWGWTYSESIKMYTTCHCLHKATFIEWFNYDRYIKYTVSFTKIWLTVVTYSWL